MHNRRTPPFLRLPYAFIPEIVPGLMGGLASSLCFYPLEVCETLIQGASVPRQAARSPPKKARISLAKPSQIPEFAHLSGIAVVKKAYVQGYLLKGFDMAFLSAFFGYTAFFSLLETGVGGNGTAGILARTFTAAAVSYLVNSPFQLLKTATILTDDPLPSHELFRKVTHDGTRLSNLWYGCVANSLGVLFVSAQWVGFEMLDCSAPVSAASNPAVQAVLYGTLATTFAVFATYPASVLRTAIMANGGETGDGENPTRLVSVAKKLLEDGGLYNGVLTSVIRSAIPAAVLFGVKSILTS